MRLFTCLSLGFLFLASSCSTKTTKPENVLTSNDFESLDGWGVDHPSLTREKAHSGQYSIKIQRGIDYSLTYSNLLGKISPSKIHKINVSGWVYTTKPTGASLTVELTDGTAFNQGISLGSKVKKPGEWTEISQVFELPASTAATNRIKIYMWGTSADEVVYLDDLLVTRE
jgi:hypothetical protein